MKRQESWQILSDTVKHKSFFKLNELTIRIKDHDGNWRAPFTRDVFIVGAAVCILPYDPVNEQFVFIKEFRAGAAYMKEDPWLLQIPAGLVEDAADTKSAARKETMEETGLTAEKIYPIFDFLPSPGSLAEKKHFFFALVDSSNAGGYHGLEHENEYIEVMTISKTKALEMLHANQFTSADIIIALQWFALNENKLNSY